MSSNFRWFKHDNDASEDLFIKALEAEFGHFGYAAYFKTLEVLSRQGVGDNLLIETRAYAKKLGTRPTNARQFLAFASQKGKFLSAETGQMLNITVKKFSEKQDRRQKNRPPSASPSFAVKEGEESKSRERKVGLSAEQRTEREPRPKHGWEDAGALVQGFLRRLGVGA